MNGYLLVRSNAKPFGLPVADVVEVADGVEASQVPGVGQAVRGITELRNRLVPIVHLAALLMDAVPDAAVSGTVVLVQCGGRLLALEVDDAYEVLRKIALPVPVGRRLPWASGIVDGVEELVPIVDFTVLAERLALVQPERVS